MNETLKNLLVQIDDLQIEIDKHRPLEPYHLKQIREYFRIGLTYTSNALEGNSLTETETKIVLEEGITIAGKPLREHLEAVGHSDAYNYMHELVQKKDFSEADIKKLHHLFYFRMDEAEAGVYRSVKAVITGSKYPLPTPDRIPKLMSEFVIRAHAIRKENHPVVAAALIHKEFEFIHPFVDGNGRVGRLLMNLVLLQSGFVSAVIPTISRRDYIQALEKAHVDDTDLCIFIARAVKETQQDYIRLFLQ